jgi:hypothetical protein
MIALFRMITNQSGDFQYSLWSMFMSKSFAEFMGGNPSLMYVVVTIRAYEVLLSK